jgi:acyl carrier protein
MTSHRASVLDMVRAALGAHLGVEATAIGEWQSLDQDLDLDPLDLVLVVLRIEEAVGGCFPVGDLERVVTVHDLVELTTSWSAKVDEAPTLRPPPLRSGMLPAVNPRRRLASS